MPSLESTLLLHRARSAGPGGHLDFAEELFLCETYCPDAATALLSSDGASQTITVYEIDVSTGVAFVGGQGELVAALNDQDLLLPAEIKSFQLDGTQAVALTADGKTYEVALCLLIIDGSLEIVAVFGDEAADTSEVAPTAADCAAALKAATIANYDDTPGLIFCRINIARAAVDTINMTHTVSTLLERSKGFRVE